MLCGLVSIYPTKNLDIIILLLYQKGSQMQHKIPYLPSIILLNVHVSELVLDFSWNKTGGKASTCGIIIRINTEYHVSEGAQ